MATVSAQEPEVIQLSVIMPVFNEISTLPHILTSVAGALPGVNKEIILVDDCSTDGTREWIQRLLPNGHRTDPAPYLAGQGALACKTEVDDTSIVIRAFFHQTNKGKGAGLHTGLAAARGEVIVIQDGDLEYDPSDWTPMYDMIAHRKLADVVYGSRFRGQVSDFPYRRQYLANRLLSAFFSTLYGQKLTDVEVCYKMFTRDVAQRLRITCQDFGCEVQMAAQMVRPRCWRIREVGVSYKGRTYEEGKGIGWRDGLKAIWYILRYRFGGLPAHP